MKPTVHKEKSLAIIYDADQMKSPAAEDFDAGYWQDRHAVSGQASGRGSAWFIDAPFGSVVLRSYLRGGWAAKISRQHYFFTTISASRPFREFNVLANLYRLGLPVPRPVAAMCVHGGVIATGAIMTTRIEGAQTLAERLSPVPDSDVRWSRLWADVGTCIQRFHAAGLWHADLNATNILLNHDSRVFLIDFDRARFTPGSKIDGKNNLSRLKRSLLKLWPESRLPTLQTAWAELIQAYHGGI